MPASRARLLLLVTLAAAQPGCGEPHPHVPDPGADPECAPGYLEVEGACAPERCGEGRWGLLETSEQTIYVDAAAAEGGDGGEAAPLTTIQAGLDLAAAQGGDRVVVAAGRYPEILFVGSDHAGLALRGRCPELVTLDASAGGAETVGIDIAVLAGTATLAGFTIEGAWIHGMYIWSGEVLLEDLKIQGSEFAGIFATSSNWRSTTVLVRRCLLSGHRIAGVFAENRSTLVQLTDTTVQDPAESSEIDSGFGFISCQGASLEARDCTIRRCRAAGALAYTNEASLLLEGCLIRDIRAPSDEIRAQGIGAYDTARITARDCRIAGIDGTGLYLANDGTHATLENSLIHDTVPRPGSPVEAMGVAITEGAQLHIRSSEILRASGSALVADGRGTTALVEDSIIRATEPGVLSSRGYGLVAYDGANVALHRSTLEDNTAVGLLAMGGGTAVQLDRSTISNTKHNEDGQYGQGIQADSGASVTISDSELRGNHAVGILADGLGTRVALVDSRVTDTAPSVEQATGMGIVAQWGAEISGHRALFARNSGPGAVADEAVVSCEGCEFAENLFAGAAAVNTGELILTGTRILDTLPDANLGGGAGVFAMPWKLDPPTVRLEASTIRGATIAGVWLAGDGRYLLRDNLIEGGVGDEHGIGYRCGEAIFATDGTSAWDGSVGLYLAGNTIQGGRAVGLLLDEATATLDDNQWQDNPLDLIVQGSGCEQAPEGLENEPLQGAELCPTWDQPTCRDSFSVYLGIADLEGSRGGGWEAALVPAWPETDQGSR